MDKNAIKKYAVWARRELISRVSQRAALYEITDKGFGDASSDSVLGRVMSAEEKRQRQALIAQIREKGYEQVMEEIAYTWFNRFIALRFMEVNGYLPSRVRVFTDDENNFKPQILAEAINMELDGLDMEKVYALKNANDDDALFKYMIIVQCNALSSILPGMFQRISDYTELLFPDNLLREGSVIEQMVSMIPEEDWTDQVQIIGWLYQYYNTEPKDKVFADLKKNIKISKENIPAATQLFTPDWIVRYMVENSLGRLWVEGHPNDELKASWKYYLDEAEQEPDVQAQLAEIRKEYAALKPEDIRAIDPCQGSGHILAYMFDVLVQIYEAYGYTAREATSSIVEHNIWGLDIDDRAAQLAYFSVMMKARQYDRRFFSRGIQPHVYAIRESKGVDQHLVDFFVKGNENIKGNLTSLLESFDKAKEYGSLIRVERIDFSILLQRLREIENESAPSIYSIQIADAIKPLLLVGQALQQKYHVVVTNPPYMNSYNMTASLNGYLRKQYLSGKNDLFSAFIIRCRQLLARNGFQGMITMHSWMFLSRYVALRQEVLTGAIENMLHLGARAFDDIGGEVVQTVSFVLRNSELHRYIGRFERLVDVGDAEGKEQNLHNHLLTYYCSQASFPYMVDSILAYWVSDKLRFHFEHTPLLGSAADCRQGIATGDNDTFLRLWYEVPFEKIGFSNTTQEEMNDSGMMYAPYNKGGAFRRWYGNRDYLIKIDPTHYQQLLSMGNHLPSRHRYYQHGLTWNDVSTALYCARYIDNGFVFDAAGPMCFFDGDEEYLLGLLNSKVSQAFLDVICQGLHYSTGHIPNIPFITSSDGHINELVKSNLLLSKQDWDSFETSWDFQIHPLVCCRDCSEGSNSTIKRAFEHWQKISQRRFDQLKENEEKLNRIFIDIYGLGEELSPEVEDKDVTVRKANLQSDVRSFISYAVGCMFGRYSLDVPGLACAGGTWDSTKYTNFQPDKDAIIPISDDEYFADDIVSRFVKFVEVAFGKETLEENLRFVADGLSSKGSPREIIRNYFINDFYNDHLKVYQKRPIYWLFDSGKKNGFKCLIYMHRYQPDTIARIRTDYVHEQQSRYRTAIADLESRIASAGTGERVKLSKQLAKLQDQAEELRVYEEKIHHLADQMIRIDLDDGVKHNYAIFQDVLAKIK